MRAISSSDLPSASRRWSLRPGKPGVPGARRARRCGRLRAPRRFRCHTFRPCVRQSRTPRAARANWTGACGKGLRARRRSARCKPGRRRAARRGGAILKKSSSARSAAAAAGATRRRRRARARSALRGRAPGRGPLVWPRRFGRARACCFSGFSSTSADVEPVGHVAADVAHIAALPLGGLAEVSADLQMAAAGALDEAAHGVVALPGALLFRRILQLVDEIRQQAGVLGLPEQDAIGGQAVAAGAARFLVILLDGFGQRRYESPRARPAC